MTPSRQWLPRSITCLRGYTVHDLTRDAIAGLTVGLVALPLAMAFAIASGVPPQVGVYTAVIAGFLISALGGSRTQIGGPTGAFVIIVAGIVVKFGIDGLALVGLVVATDVQGRCDGVEQSAARCRLRCVDTITSHGIQRRPRSRSQIGINVEFVEVHRERGPAHLGHQMGVQVSPRFAYRLYAAGHGDRLECPKAFVATIISEQEFTAPNRPVITPS